MTAERVPLTLPLAGIGERAIATVVDALLLLCFLIALLFVYTLWGRGDLDAEVRAASRTIFILLGVGFLVGIVSYDIFFDLVFEGRTPGKRLTRLRVVDATGQSPDLLTSMLRNLMRLVDMLPLGYGVGAVTMFFTDTRRLGDLVAGTVVVSERARGLRAWDAAVQAAKDGNVGAPAWSDDDVAAAVDVVCRTQGLADVPAQIPCLRVLQGLRPIPDSDPGAQCQARTMLAAAVVALGQANEGLASHLRRLAETEDQLRAALQGFEQRKVSADLVDSSSRQASSELLLATRRGTPPRHLEALSLALLDLERLRRPPGGARLPRLRSFLAVEVPLAVWSERRNIARAASVLGLALLLGFAVSYADADVARVLVSDDLAAQIERGATWTNDIEREQAYASTAATIIVNNVGVGMRVFALGILGGVATLMGLVSNGLSIGAVFGYATQLGTWETLLRFIVAHAPVELSMICVAGGAGLCLGRALLAPGRRSRLQALRQEGARGLRLLVFATIGFVVIGTVEGFVSPGTHFPTALNAAVGAGLWLLFAAWVLGARPQSTTVTTTATTTATTTTAATAT